MPLRESDNDILLQLTQLVGQTDRGMVGEHRPVNLILRQGEVGVLLGGNRTRVLLQVIMNLGQLLSGQIELFGRKEQNSKKRGWQPGIGYAFRQRGLLSNMTILDNTDLPARYHGLYTDAGHVGLQAAHVLKELLVPERYWSQLPSMVPEEIRKKALLARAAVLQPRLLLLDDPTAMIRWPEVPRILRWLEDKRNQGMGILLATPEYPVGLALADWVLEPDKGEMATNFQATMDPSWLEVAQILQKAMLNYEAVI